MLHFLLFERETTVNKIFLSVLSGFFICSCFGMDKSKRSKIQNQTDNKKQDLEIDKQEQFLRNYQGSWREDEVLFLYYKTRNKKIENQQEAHEKKNQKRKNQTKKRNKKLSLSKSNSKSKNDC